MASEKPAYPLARSFRASARLNLQHFLYKKDIGWLVHPTVGLQAQQNPKVLDVGTGTGVWLIDLGDELGPSATLDGIDVSDEQYPPNDWLSPNIRLSVHDIFADLPDGLIGKYDLVNIRYFLLVVRDSDPYWIIQQAFKMLKPGGYLQWADYDNHSASNIASPGVSAAPWDALKTEIEEQTHSRPAQFQWLNELDDSMERAGFTDVIKERKYGRKDNYSFWQHVNLTAAEEMSYSVPGGDKIRELVARNQLETPKGIYWNRPHLIFVAKKPLQ